MPGAIAGHLCRCSIMQAGGRPRIRRRQDTGAPDNRRERPRWPRCPDTGVNQADGCAHESSTATIARGVRVHDRGHSRERVVRLVGRRRVLPMWLFDAIADSSATSKSSGIRDNALFARIRATYRRRCHEMSGGRRTGRMLEDGAQLAGRAGRATTDGRADPVSYTHLTPPTSDLV